MTKRSREEETKTLVPDPEILGPADNACSRTDLNTSLMMTTNSKYIQLDPDSIVPPTPVIRCSLPPHQRTISFTTYEEYEVHYTKAHTNRCLECWKNFPTDHYLSLHIEENHDALFSLKRERGDKMYACFVESCDRRCSTPQKRRMHLIDKHMFPKEYDFHILSHGIGGRSSMLQFGKHRKRSLTAPTMNQSQDNDRIQKFSHADTSVKEKESTPLSGDQSSTAIKDDFLAFSTNEQKCSDMEDLSASMSALKFVPSSVRFGGRGRGRGRSGLSRYR